MTRLRLYIDEDSMDDDFVAALRARGVDARTARDEGMRGRTDIEQLRWDATRGRALYSFNVADFSALHVDFLRRGEQQRGLSWPSSNVTRSATSCAACSSSWRRAPATT